MVRFRVNGKRQSFDGDEETPLLWVLRDVIGLTGTKYGCGAGLCGACTVQVDGDAVRSCQTLIADVSGSRITTIEGLENERLRAAWGRYNVPQCGYCQAGQLMQAAALLERKTSPTDEDIDLEMQGNICRCGTYQRIKAAIKWAGREKA